MVQPVGEDRVAAPGERGEDREIGEIAGRERQRPRPGAGPHERGELGFERRVRREVAADEVRRARADTPARRAVARGRDDVRVLGETEVVVAREGNELAAVDDDARALRRGERAPDPLQSRGLPRREAALEIGDQSAGRHVAGVEPQLREQRAVGVDVGVAGRQQLVAVEDRVRAGEEAQRLDGVAQLAPARRQPHHGLRHRDPRDGDRAHEIERVERGGAAEPVVERRAFDLHQLVDRHRLRIRVHVRELRDQPGALRRGLAHPDDAAAADADAGRRGRGRACRAGPGSRAS